MKVLHLIHKEILHFVILSRCAINLAPSTRKLLFLITASGLSKFIQIVSGILDSRLRGNDAYRREPNPARHLCLPDRNKLAELQRLIQRL